MRVNALDNVTRLTLLPLASRDHLERGELKQIIRELASKTYQIPGSKRMHLSASIIERWYYLWLSDGIEALSPKPRQDKHHTQLSEEVQSALLAIKKDNPARSLNTLISMVESQGIVARGKLARATVHRFLQHRDLSKQTLADAATIERRSFVASYAGDIWQGDVLHGPQIPTLRGMRKTYLVSLLDDASRLITHCAFCLGETAVDVESVLKDAILKRGIPKKLIVDNGAAYKAGSLQGICARLQVRLIYCPVREPEGKGKLERYHRFFRQTFLNELDIKGIKNLGDLNARLWAWVETVYHQRAHGGLENKMTPLERWRQDLFRIRQLGTQAALIDDIFYHRVLRLVRKDGTVSWEGKLFEVPYELSGKKIQLVFDPQTKKVHRVESDVGENLGPITLLDTTANLNRKRQRPDINKKAEHQQKKFDAVEMAYENYQRSLGITHNNNNNDEEM